jgi:hypothetical protein
MNGEFWNSPGYPVLSRCSASFQWGTPHPYAEKELGNSERRV